MELKLENVSAILHEESLPWVDGYEPAGWEPCQDAYGIDCIPILTEPCLVARMGSSGRGSRKGQYLGSARVYRDSELSRTDWRGTVTRLSVVVALLLTASLSAVTQAQAPTDAGTPTWTLEGSGEIEFNQALHDLLPDSIKEAGAIEWVTDPSFAPYGFYAEDNTTIIGGDPSLAQAISEVLGVEAHLNATAFAGIIPAMKAGRYDISISAMGDTPLREQEINFVVYSTEGNALVVPAGNPLGIVALEDLCGKRIAVATGTIMESLAIEQDGKCTDKIDIQVYPDQNQANLAVMSDRADATMNMAGGAQYYVKTGVDQGLEVLLDNLYGRGYNAMGFTKDDTTLMMCVQQALQRLIDSGAYYDILDEWGMTGGYLDPPFVWINDGARFAQGQG